MYELIATVINVVVILIIIVIPVTFIGPLLCKMYLRATMPFTAGINKLWPISQM